MDVLKTLKEFKKIEPGKDYTRKSRLLILGEEKRGPQAWSSLFWSSLRFSAGAALTGVVIVLVIAGFSIIRFSSQDSLKSLDPITLTAEAEAIDIQIKLTQLAYDNPVQLIIKTSTVNAILNKSYDGRLEDMKQESKPLEKIKEIGDPIEDKEDETEKTTTVEEALERLSQ